MIEQAIGRLAIVGPAALVALFLSLELIVLLRPWLVRFALVRPISRSSHSSPTPQGGGIAVVAATLAVAWAAIALFPALLGTQSPQFLAVTAALMLLAAVGAIDDWRSLTASTRLVMQSVAVAVVISALPSEQQFLPNVPWWTERACLLIGGVWFVNLVNFMDGIDWMTVVELVPLTGTLVALGLFGTIELLPTVVAAALLAAILGFAPFNKPVAQLFLGDVGSLPIGLLLGWLLLQLAGEGHLAAALILPLYYLADATSTLVWRIARREPFWQAHRKHFYQRATDNGFSVSAIVGRVFLINVALGVLALTTVAASAVAVSLFTLAAAIAIVAWLLTAFARSKN